LSARVDTTAEIDPEMQLTHWRQSKNEWPTTWQRCTRQKKTKGKGMQNTLESLHLSAFKETEVHETHFELMDKRTGSLLTEKKRSHKQDRRKDERRHFNNRPIL